MKEKDYGDYIQDILDSINEIDDFIKGISFENFIKDKKTINAVIRSIEIMGEAAKNIPDEFRKKHNKVPWQKMIGMRNKLIHEYSGVDYEIVWHTIKNELPPLKPVISEVLKTL